MITDAPSWALCSDARDVLALYERDRGELVHYRLQGAEGAYVAGLTLRGDIIDVIHVAPAFRRRGVASHLVAMVNHRRPACFGAWPSTSAGRALAASARNNDRGS